MARHEMDLDATETIGLAALAFLAEDGVRLNRFLSSTGFRQGSCVTRQPHRTRC